MKYRIRVDFGALKGALLKSWRVVITPDTLEALGLMAGLLGVIALSVGSVYVLEGIVHPMVTLLGGLVVYGFLYLVVLHWLYAGGIRVVAKETPGAVCQRCGCTEWDPEISKSWNRPCGRTICESCARTPTLHHYGCFGCPGGDQCRLPL